MGLGIALVLYAGYTLISPASSVPSRVEPWMSPIIGLVTGAITGATGVFVMPAVPYLQALRPDRNELVQALGLSFTVSTVALACGLLTHGAFRLEQLGLSTLAIVPALAGMWLGQGPGTHQPQALPAVFPVVPVAAGARARLTTFPLVRWRICSGGKRTFGAAPKVR